MMDAPQMAGLMGVANLFFAVITSACWFTIIWKSGRRGFWLWLSLVPGLLAISAPVAIAYFTHAAKTGPAAYFVVPVVWGLISTLTLVTIAFTAWPVNRPVNGPQAAGVCAKCGGSGFRRCTKCKGTGALKDGKACDQCGGGGELPCGCGENSGRTVT